MAAVVDFHSLEAMKKKEMILRDIYKAEELKIDSSRSRLLQKTIDDLWGSDSKEFDEVFRKVCSDVMKIRKEKGTNEPLQEMFQYLAETLPERLEFSKPKSVNYGDPILWHVSLVCKNVRIITGQSTDFFI